MEVYKLSVYKLYFFKESFQFIISLYIFFYNQWATTFLTTTSFPIYMTAFFNNDILIAKTSTILNKF